MVAGSGKHSDHISGSLHVTRQNHILHADLVKPAQNHRIKDVQTVLKEVVIGLVLLEIYAGESALNQGAYLARNRFRWLVQLAFFEAKVVNKFYFVFEKMLKYIFAM